MTTPLSRDEAIAALTGPAGEFELEEIPVDGHVVRNFKHAPATLRALYEKHRSGLPFIRYEDEQWTFAQAWQECSRIAHLLMHGCGVQRGDRVAISMRNYPEWMLAFSAVTSIGAVAVAMNAHWQPDELAHALADSGARVLFADQERLDRLALCAAMPGLRVFGVRASRLTGGAQSLRDALSTISDDVTMPDADIAPDDLAIMLYTSGSSGRAKGVPSTHRNVISALTSWALDLRILELSNPASEVPAKPIQQAATLLAVPLFHVTGLHSSFLQSYQLQRRVVAMYRWNPEVAAQLIERQRITSITAPAAITGDLVRVAKTGQYDLSSLVAVGGGGAPRAPEQVRQIDQVFENAVPNIGWGMTETNAIGAGNAGPDYLERPDSSGRCSQVLDMRIVDEAGHDLPRGERGELWIRGTSVFAGYWNLPQANAASFVDGWFRTGDGAYIDDDGFLFIVDRIKDLIIRGGENIGCGHVEAVLLMHPDVREASVYAVPDERLGEQVGATVHGSDTLELERLREFLRDHLAHYEIPKYLVHSREPLPRTPSGKIFKREIRAAAIAQLTKSNITLPS